MFGANLLQDVAFGTTTLKYDTGEKQTMPRAILTAMKSHVIEEYERFCSDLQMALSLSDSALWKILRAIKPSQRHAMAGLENLTADGLKGFLILSGTVKKICDDSKERKLLQQHLEDGKRYLKIGYRMHCKDISPIDTHCIRFALLHSQGEDFKPHHDHEHQDVCEQCLSLFLTIEAVEKLAVAIDDIELRQELLYDIKLSRTYIIEWMCHVLRGVQQEKAKLCAISQLDPLCGFWLSDWAQKVIPSMFREGQRDYFVKKGMFVHVNVLLTKAVASSELIKSVYFTTIYRCEQDVTDTLCVAEHVLKEIQKDHPNIKQLFRKTDNAGCYSGNSAAEIECSICRQNGFTLLRRDYNEPQKGKDKADRESALAKKYMNGF